MKRAEPPKILEALVGLLTPAARREDTAGDLHERYTSPTQYLADALQVLPAIIWSQIRRTTDLQLLLIEFSGLVSCFLAAALWLEPQLFSEPLALLRVSIPAASWSWSSWSPMHTRLFTAGTRPC